MSRWLAFKTSVFLVLFFLLVYGGSNYLAYLRNDVGTWFWEWERHIPFVAWMIIPYLSIDPLFVISPFLCRTREELRLLLWRLVITQIATTSVFLAMPLRFAFERPQPQGLIGWPYRLLHFFDPPHNLFPSQHVALVVVLAPLFAARTPKAWRWFVYFWGGMITVSTVLSYQHHTVDVLGGLVLGALVLALVRDRGRFSLPQAAHGI